MFNFRPRPVITEDYRAKHFPCPKGRIILTAGPLSLLDRTDSERRHLTGSENPEDLPPVVGDQRQNGRRRVLLGGVIINRTGSQTWDCTVKDMSEHGVKIRLGEGQVIPSHCIFLNLRDGIGHMATVQWMHPPFAGLKLLDSFRLDELADPALQFVRRLWVERRRR